MKLHLACPLIKEQYAFSVVNYMGISVIDSGVNEFKKIKFFILNL